MSGRIAPETGLIDFSERYKLTEFRIEVGEFPEVSMSVHRAADIREWWTAAGVPVVLRARDRHLVPKENKTTDYDAIRVPFDMVPDKWEHIEGFLVPDAAACRRLTGSSHD